MSGTQMLGTQAQTTAAYFSVTKGRFEERIYYTTEGASKTILLHQEAERSALSTDSSDVAHALNQACALTSYREFVEQGEVVSHPTVVDEGGDVLWCKLSGEELLCCEDEILGQLH